MPTGGVGDAMCVIDVLLFSQWGTPKQHYSKLWFAAKGPISPFLFSSYEEGLFGSRKQWSSCQEDEKIISFDGRG